MTHLHTDTRVDLSQISLPRGLDCLRTECWSRTDVPTHLRFAGYDLGSGPMFRLVLGELIPSLQRECFPLLRAEHFAEKHDLSGSIGFMDFAVTPRDAAVTIFLLGIEAKYQKQGLGSECLAYVERVADEFSMPFARVIAVGNPDLGEMLLRRGYVRPLGQTRVYEKMLVAPDAPLR